MIGANDKSIEKRSPRNVAAEEVSFFEGVSTRVLANIANNHTLDFGPEGLKRTCNFLRSQNVDVCGHKDQLFSFDVQSFRIGIVSFSVFGGGESFNQFDDEAMEKVGRWKDAVDFLLILCH